MSEANPVYFCQYVFDEKQYRNAWRAYWRHARLKWFLLIIIAVAVGSTFFAGHPQHVELSPSQHFWEVAGDLGPVIIFVAILIWALEVSRRAFRKTLQFNQQVRWSLREDGLSLESPTVKSELGWKTYDRVYESLNGFSLYIKGARTFTWLPKNGFENAESVHRCRELLRQKIAKSRLLPDR